MKQKYLLFIFLCFSVLSYGQTTIYQENFTGQLDKGASGSLPSVDLTGVTWTINTANASSSNSYRFIVVNSNNNELFQARNVGSSTWITPIISITSFTNVGFTIDASQSGNLENTDTVTTQYRINGGIWLNATTNGLLFNNYGDVTISQTQISGNTLQLRVILANNSNGERQYIDNVTVTGTPQPMTYTYNNGWDTDPNGVATLADTINVVAGEATIYTNTKGNTLTVNPTGSLVINTGTTLELNGSLEMESISNQYSSLISNGTILGTVNYKRHVNTFATNVITGNNDLVSAPVTNASQTFGVFIAQPDNLNIPSGTIGGVPSFLFGPFDRDNNTYTNYNVGNLLDPLQAGIGYRTASIVPGGSTLLFTGDVLTGTVPVSISIGTLSEWNLIGNPYTSYINSGDFLTANAAFLDIDAIGIYGYDGFAHDGWTILNFNTMNTANNMTPGQGFLVAAKNSATLNFTPSMRRNTGSDDFIIGRSSMETNHYLKLKINNANSNYHTDFYFNDKSSRNLDPGYDARLFNATLPSLRMYSHLVDNNEGVSMAIQSLGATDLSDVSIPLGVHANQGEQITFSIVESTLPSTIDVYLDDTVANTSTLLNNTNYVLTPDANLSGTGRFFLRYTENALSTIENSFDNLNIYTSKATKDIVVNGQLMENTICNIYDIQGRLVSVSKLNHTALENRIDVSMVSTGIYIVKLQSNTIEKTQKLVIK